MYDFERRKSLNEIKHRSAFSFALPIMIPMGLSFFFLGLGFGLYATSQGYLGGQPLFWLVQFLQALWSL